MNIRLLLALIAGTIVLGILVYLFQVKDNPPFQDASQTTQTTASPVQLPPNSGRISEDISSYEITKGTASYFLKKKFFSKPDVTVVGTTSGVTGVISQNNETNEIIITANVDLFELDSGDEARDAGVLKKKILFEKDAIFTTAFVQEVILGEAFELRVPGDLMINGVKNPVTLVVTGVATKDSVEIVGKADILLTDFGITPPGVVEVYTSDDAVELTFKATANRINP